MSILADYLRPYWLKGINEVNSNVKKGLAGWVLEKDFQIYTPIKTVQAIISISNSRTMVSAFAADSSRLAAAAIESIHGITPQASLPKSSGWLVIRSYYAAFFAAHSLLRMFGISCTQFDAAQANAVNEVADLYGMRNGINFSKGFYRCQYNEAAKSLTCDKFDSADGSHGAVWRIFYEEVNRISSDILKNRDSSTNTQQVVSKLIDLCRSLNDGSSSGRGCWLSQIRNRINYKHELGVWFPYELRSDYYDQLYDLSKFWTKDPMTVTIWPSGRDLQRFSETCSIITGMCRIVCSDMSLRCPKGKSFQHYGSINLIKRLIQEQT